MKIGNIKHKGKNCYACYITYDYEEFNDLRLAKKHVEFKSNNQIFYIITDEEGNTIHKKQIQ